MCGETRIPRDMCAGNTIPGETHITVTAEKSHHKEKRKKRSGNARLQLRMSSALAHSTTLPFMITVILSALRIVHGNPTFLLLVAIWSRCCLIKLISNVDWEEILNPLNFSEAWHYFSTVFDDIVLECIPLEIPRLKKNTFMSHKALLLKNKKCKLWNRYTATRSLSTYHSYCQVRNTLRGLTRNLRYSYEKKLASNFNSNTKHFWKYVNTRLKSRPVIDSLKKSDDTVVYSDEDKSQLFNQFFTSVLILKRTPIPYHHFILTEMFQY